MIAQPPGTHLAQLNIGWLVADTHDPAVAPFMDNLDRVNGAGKRMPGFVWMMEGAPGQGNTEVKLDDDPRLISNLTVWEDVTSLRDFVFETIHVKFMARRSEWFERMETAHFVMWWVPQGHRPTLAEALERLDHLRANGPSGQEFGWAQIQGGAIA
jgi:hypothetical protein